MPIPQPADCSANSARGGRAQTNRSAPLAVTFLSAVGLYAIAIVVLLAAQGILSF